MPETEPRPRISVVIPHYNDEDALAKDLAALTAQRDDGVSFEIIVVDNGSARLPTAVCARFPVVRLLSETTPGPGPARSHGAANARGEILAFVDADCCPDPGWILAIDRAFADPSTEIIGGDVRIAPVDPARMTVVEAYESVFAYRIHLYIARDNYTGTGNMAVRPEIFRDVGPFAGIGVAEDMDWGRRATAMGYRLTYVPEMRVRTPARRDFAELARKWDRHIAHFYAENSARRVSPAAAQLRWLARTAMVAVSPLGEVLRIARSDRLARPADRARALVGVTRLRLYRAGQMLRLGFGADPARLTRGWRET
jgi:glycosyltransferase involved in cell wall biosynthesis